MMEQIILIALLTALVIIAVAIVRIHDLLTVIMLLSLYSLISASIFVIMDAVDVAFTEAAVGVGISTLLMLGALALTTSKQKLPSKSNIAPLLVVSITGAALIYGTLNMPLYGDPNAPVHLRVAPRYIKESEKEIGVPNMVTSVLAMFGISTLLMLGALALTTSKQKLPSKSNIAPLLVVSITGAALIYGTLNMPLYGDPNAPVHLRVAPRYIKESEKEIGVPNMVTSVLASYRGYDTLGEVLVVFTASITVLSLLGRGRKKARKIRIK